MPADDDTAVDPWAAVLGEDCATKYTAESRPSNNPVPDPNASWWQLAEFALTFDGYTVFGGFDRLSDMPNGTARAWHDRRSLPATLDEARGSLFFEQRRNRHLDVEPRGADMDYVRALVQCIHDLSDGAVERQSPAL